MPSNAFLLEERIPAGCHHALLLKRGYALRLTDLSGDGNVGLLASTQTNAANAITWGTAKGPAHPQARLGQRALFRYGATPALDHRGQLRLA